MNINKKICQNLKYRISQIQKNYTVQYNGKIYVGVFVKLYNWTKYHPTIIDDIIVDEFESLNNPHKYHEINKFRSFLNCVVVEHFDFLIDYLQCSFDDFMNGHKHISRYSYNIIIYKVMTWYKIGKNVGDLSSIFHFCNKKDGKMIPDDLNGRLTLLYEYYKDDLEISDNLKILNNEYVGFLGKNGGYLAIVDMSVLSDIMDDIDHDIDNNENDLINNHKRYIDALEWLIEYIEGEYRMVNREKYYYKLLSDNLKYELKCIL